MQTSLWLSSSIFSWDGYCESSLAGDGQWRRSYEIWNRASLLVERCESTFDLADGISNLKRSMDHRLALIESRYNFRKIRGIRIKGYLELLESLEIVRPYIMKSLREIRNNIEHHDIEPPDRDRCKEFVDVVWYFLKSTDSYVQMQKHGFAFTLYNNNNEETHYGFSINIDYSLHSNFDIYGWFPIELISLNQADGFFPVICEKFHGKEIWEDGQNKLPDFYPEDFHHEKLPTDKWIAGTANVDEHKYVEVLSHLLPLF